MQGWLAPVHTQHRLRVRILLGLALLAQGIMPWDTGTGGVPESDRSAGD